MLYVKSVPMELRGIAHRPKKNTGEVYYIVNAELEDGTAYSFYCPKATAFGADLKKGDKVEITFEVSYYYNKERLIVEKVEKVRNA